MTLHAHSSNRSVGQSYECLYLSGSPPSVGPSDHRPIDELLPPLTSSNEVDQQLYAILAIIAKEYVYSWYGKIAADQGFVEEVVRIFAHCTRALEQRVRKVDIEGVLLDDIPQLVQEHINGPFAVRYTPLRSIPESCITLFRTPRTVEAQYQNEVAYRQLLVQGALAVLLDDIGKSGDGARTSELDTNL